MAANGALSGYLPGAWIMKLEDLPTPPEILSERIKHLLGLALLEPQKLTNPEIQELAASVVYHLAKVREEAKQEREKDA